MGLPPNIRETESWTMKALLLMTGPHLLASAQLGRRVGLRFSRLLTPPLLPARLAASRTRVPPAKRIASGNPSARRPTRP